VSLFLRMIFYILGFIQGPYTIFKYRDNICVPE
jgi:hypothetical protein